MNTVSNLSAQINSFVTHFSSRVKKVDPKRFGIEVVRFISLVDVLTHEAPEHVQAVFSFETQNKNTIAESDTWIQQMYSASPASTLRCN